MRVVGRDGTDIDIAHIHNTVVNYDWYQSSGKALYGQAVLDALTRSVGYLQVDIDPQADQGQGEVRFKCPHPHDVVIDPQSTDFLFRDAAYMIVRKLHPRDVLKLNLPKYASKIDKATSSESYQVSYSERDTDDTDNYQREDILEAYSHMGEEADVLDYYERYYRTTVPCRTVWTRKPWTDEEKARIQREVEARYREQVQEIDVQVEERKHQIADMLESGNIIAERAELEVERAEEMAEEAKALAQQQIQAEVQELFSTVEKTVMTEKEFQILQEDEQFQSLLVESIEFYKPQIKKVCSVGDTFLYEETLDTQHYTIVPFCYTHTGTPYPMSAVTPMVGKQRELNKAHQLMIHNANVSSNPRWLYEQGALAGQEEIWEEYATMPGAMLPYGAGKEPPVPIFPQPLNQAFFQIVQEGKEDLEYISGMPAQLQGLASGQEHDTYRGLLAQNEHATRRIRSWMENVVEPALQQLGLVHKDYAQNLYTTHRVFRLVQPEPEDTLEAEINIPIFDDFGDVIGRWNDYATTQFDVMIIPGATLPVNRWALLSEYMRWAEAGIVDDIFFLEKADIPDKDRIIKRKSLYAQLQQQIEEREEEIKSLRGDVETLRRQVIQSGIREEIDDTGTKLKKMALETQAQEKFYQQQLDQSAKDQQSTEETAENA